MSWMTPAAAPPLDAGPFSTWLTSMTAALRGEGDADVPCDGCTACCTASQFVTIGPDETDAIAHIPKALLFPAPGRPGHFVLGYDERGHCPMLADGGCSVYEHRPRACRTYDCRVFVAAGVEIDEPRKRRLAHRVEQWRFTYDGPDDRGRRDAVQAAARHLRDRARNETELAVLAVEHHADFLDVDT
jgi:Fe-S-cluster containining protein